MPDYSFDVRRKIRNKRLNENSATRVRPCRLLLAGNTKLKLSIVDDIRKRRTGRPIKTLLQQTNIRPIKTLLQQTNISVRSACFQCATYTVVVTSPQRRVEQLLMSEKSLMTQQTCYMLLSSVKALFHSQKLTRKLAARTFIQSQYMKALAASLRVGFCDE